MIQYVTKLTSEYSLTFLLFNLNNRKLKKHRQYFKFNSLSLSLSLSLLSLSLSLQLITTKYVFSSISNSFQFHDQLYQIINNNEYIMTI